MLVSIFPQLPCLIFMTFYQEHLFPFDKAAGWLMLAMLAGELVFGWQTMRRMIRRQTEEFYRSCNAEAMG